jgi:GAF domain-containing protein
MVGNQERRVDNAIGLVVFPTGRGPSAAYAAYDSLFSEPALEYDAQPNLWFPVGISLEVVMAAAPPSIEAARIAALNRYAILDTEPEQSFDDLVTLAAHICKTPMAMLSLVDEHRQWFKSKVGVQVRETPREVSICTHAIQQDDLFVVPDTWQDPRFRDNPLVVGEPRVRFYAGAPLINEDGFALGTLCVVDREPRELDEDQKNALLSLRRLALAQMELRQNLRLLKDALNDRTKEEHARELEVRQLEEKLIRVLGLKL